MPPFAERVWQKTDQTGDCWQVGGYHDGHGYAHLSVPEGDGYRYELAHHWAWFDATGEWPPEKAVVGHTCDVPACIRNDDVGTYEVRGLVFPRRGHLWLCTQADNLADMTEKGRRRKYWAEQTHCAAGHEYNEENTYIGTRSDGSTRRRCRLCRTEQVRRWRESRSL